MSDHLKLGLTLIREALTQERFARQPEPMVMDEAAQVSAYADSGRQHDGVMAVSNLFHAAHATTAIFGAKKVIDLGCGPATQLVRIARLNPETHFVGVELAHNMIESARTFIRDQGVTNIEIVEGDITRLDGIADQSVDGIVSTMTLHHLPGLGHLRECFQQIRRVMKPNSGIYLADFGRFKSLNTVYFFAHMHEKTLPTEVVQDYEYSLKAAFSPAEYREIVDTMIPGSAAVHATFLAPFMVIIKSKTNRVTDPALRQKLKALREVLSPGFQQDLDDLRLFFRLGGLSDDFL
jgi:ubiquinone/menaquinone biosynthesis C-methylase UbiE